MFVLLFPPLVNEPWSHAVRLNAFDHIVPIWSFKLSRITMFFVSSRSSFKYGQLLTLGRVLTLPIVNGAGSANAFTLRYGTLWRAFEHRLSTIGTPGWRTGQDPATGLVACVVMWKGT